MVKKQNCPFYPHYYIPWGSHKISTCSVVCAPRNPNGFQLSVCHSPTSAALRSPRPKAWRRALTSSAPAAKGSTCGFVWEIFRDFLGFASMCPCFFGIIFLTFPDSGSGCSLLFLVFLGIWIRVLSDFFEDLTWLPRAAPGIAGLDCLDLAWLQNKVHGRNRRFPCFSKWFAQISIYLPVYLLFFFSTQLRVSLHLYPLIHLVFSLHSPPKLQPWLRSISSQQATQEHTAPWLQGLQGRDRGWDFNCFYIYIYIHEGEMNWFLDISYANAHTHTSQYIILHYMHAYLWALIPFSTYHFWYITKILNHAFFRF